MAKVRFIHTADLHLGSLLHIGEGLGEAQTFLRQATYTAFESIVDTALDYEVDFILIAGDLFDQKARSVEAESFFLKQCHRLSHAGIFVYVITGNHDPAPDTESLFQFPENVRIFSGEQVEEVVFPPESKNPLVQIVGQSYQKRSESRKLHLSYQASGEYCWNIGLLHTQLDPSNVQYLPASAAELKAQKGFDYWALGHIHQFQMIQKADPVIAFPGIPQGRDWGELGVGGCLLVELAEYQKTRLEYIPISPIVWKRISISIEGSQGVEEPKNVTDIEELLARASESLLREKPEIVTDIPVAEWNGLQGYVVQWVLTGRGAVHELLQEQEEEVAKILTENLRTRFKDRTPFLWTDSIRIRTAPPLPSLRELESENELYQELGIVLEVILQDEEIRQQLLAELGQIWGWQVDHENDLEDQFQLNPILLEELVNQVEGLIIEKLLAGREKR